MEQQLVELLREVNIAQIFIIFAGGWVFYNRLDNKITKSEDRLSDQIKTVKSELKEEIKILGNKVEDIDRRLCRIEGGITLAHFAYHQSRAQKVDSQPEEPHPQAGSAV
jgi:predicted nuclease with TOPRIM domain